ncbi:MAG: excinuclease ABC subunit UvrA [Myxococcales bacterium]|nr:excinuclease ABC subunit UvrA [Myxococcales bacterium]
MIGTGGCGSSPLPLPLLTAGRPPQLAKTNANAAIAAIRIARIDTSYRQPRQLQCKFGASAHARGDAVPFERYRSGVLGLLPASGRNFSRCELISGASVNSAKHITIRGAREHNLKGIDLDLPRDALVVITGISGSGKSSLAFDTIYAEGQRRYVESLSAYARQFLERMERPDVDSIEGLSPAISIEQRGLSRNPRSTLATVTELYDHLRLLYARVGAVYCPRCGTRVEAQSTQQMVERVLALPERTRFGVLAPVAQSARADDVVAKLDELRAEGYTRVNIDGEVCDLGEPLQLAGGSEARHDVDVYVDRLVLKDGVRSRLWDSLELALGLGDGVAKIALVDAVEGDDDELVLSELPICGGCGSSLPELTPQLFSWSSPHGACARCAGIGALLELDEALVVPDPTLSLREGAIEPWAQRGRARTLHALENLARHYDFSLDVPYAELSAEQQRVLMHGSGDEVIAWRYGDEGKTFERPWGGVLADLARRSEERESRRGRPSGAQAKRGGRERGEDAVEAPAGWDDVEGELGPYTSKRRCPECDGERLRPEARAVRVGDVGIGALLRMSVGQALEHLRGLELGAREAKLAERLLAEIDGRLSFLVDVGVGYLTLDRPSATLSGGEGQRVRLATQIGSSLVGVLYILDEPSVGLHQRDNDRLLATLRRLRDAGNSVLVVEHDADTIRAADYIVDLGPGAGEHGGHVVAAGTLDEILRAPGSLTGQYLSGQRQVTRRRTPRKVRGKLRVRGARRNNLRDIDVDIPLGQLVCVSGVSGSGKSSLVLDTLLPALRSALHRARPPADGLGCDSITGVELIDKVVAIDQGPIGRTPRSNPATYCGLFAPIRDLFAGVPDARVRGYKPGRFSFNVKGGRCEACRGDGVQRIEMHFLPDVYVPCEVCAGLRYNEETLRVRYKGLSIAQVLELSVQEAHEVFVNVPRVREKLEVLASVGLGYLRLGQSATTLSGGEAQRVKLARELSRRATGNTLYILDEPTTGLHFADVDVLVGVLSRLVDAGNSVLVIEHDLEVIASADHVIDLGPEGGADGGTVVAAGTPRVIARAEGSFTGSYLAPLLGSRR